MYQNASASGWQSAGEKAARESTVTARPWLDAGCRYAYQYFHARAVASIASWGSESGGYPGRKNRKYRFMSKGNQLGLNDLVSSYPFIKRAVDITSVKGNAPGPDGETFYTTFQCGTWGEEPIQQIKRALRRGTYRPGGLRAVRIRIGDKVRTLHIPNLVDRVVERAIAFVLVAIVESAFHPWSFGFRPGICITDATRELMSICMTQQRFVIGKVDLKDAFDRVPQNRLLDIIAQHVPDTDLMKLIQRIVCRETWVNKQGKQNIGLPQGGPMSPVLFNIYLNHVLDQVISKAGVKFIRWADDIALLCESQEQLVEHRELVKKLLNGAGLPVNTQKTYAPAATADLRKGEKIELLGFNIGLNKTKEIVLEGTEDATLSLMTTLELTMCEQTPNVSWDGRRQSLLDLCLFDIGGWLEAYAGAIHPDQWTDIRKMIKGWFLGDVPPILQGCEDSIISLRVHCPSTEALNGLYERARRHWDWRMRRPIPGVLDRLVGRKRDANPNNMFRQTVPDFIADGADLVPAPTVFIRVPGDVKPTSSEIDWRAELAETESVF